MAIKLLDCTLRDGGHQNSSRFGECVINDIIRGMTDAYIDIVEVGFLRHENIGKDVAAEDSIVEFEKRVMKAMDGKVDHSTRYAVMIQQDQYKIEKLPECRGIIKDIRVSFHDYDQKEGIRYCKEVIKKGYRCYVNPINVVGYDDHQIIQLIKEVNDMHAYAFTLVDTFGSFTREDFQRIFLLANHNLNKNISLGIHLHDNLQLSFALAQLAIDMSSEKRDIVIDGSLLGMGREPGNLCIELIMDYINRKNGIRYNVDLALDLIDDYIAELKKKYPWGYETSYALSAQYKVHRSYAEYLFKKQKLNTRRIRQILAMISNDKKSRYDEEYIEKLYVDCITSDVDDSETLKKLETFFSGRNILLIAPGKSINDYKSQICRFIDENNPIVISANVCIPWVEEDFIFCSNEKRLEKLKNYEYRDRMIISSTLRNNINEDAQFVNMYKLGWFGEVFWDNCMLMLLQLLKKVNIKECYTAGWDGFSGKGNFYDPAMESIYRYTDENILVKNIVSNYLNDIKINFITPSEYENQDGV